MKEYLEEKFKNLQRLDRVEKDIAIIELALAKLVDEPSGDSEGLTFDIGKGFGAITIPPEQRRSFLQERKHRLKSEIIGLEGNLEYGNWLAVLEYCKENDGYRDTRKGDYFFANKKPEIKEPKQ